MLHIRNLIFLLFLANIACNSQQTKTPETTIDTVRLFDPNPEPRSAAEALMFTNCVLLFGPDFRIFYAEKDTIIEEAGNLSPFFAEHAPVISQSKFYIITDSATTFERTKVVIDLLVKSKIPDYKVVNYQSYFDQPGRDSIEMPVAISRTVSDSSLFIIGITAVGIEVNLNGQPTVIKVITHLDQYIKANQSIIAKKQIMIRASADSKSGQFTAVTAILKKFGFVNFQLVTVKIDSVK